MTTASSASRRPRRTGRWVAFWSLAVFGVVVMIASWAMLHAASLEQISERSKALAAGSTTDGFIFWLGWVPLIIAHVVGFVIMISVASGLRSDRRSGMRLGVWAVVAASAIGLIVTLVLTGGQLIVLETPEVP